MPIRRSSRRLSNSSPYRRSMPRPRPSVVPGTSCTARIESTPPIAWPSTTLSNSAAVVAPFKLSAKAPSAAIAFFFRVNLASLGEPSFETFMINPWSNEPVLPAGVLGQVFRIQIVPKPLHKCQQKPNSPLSYQIDLFHEIINHARKSRMSCNCISDRLNKLRELFCEWL